MEHGERVESEEPLFAARRSRRRSGERSVNFYTRQSTVGRQCGGGGGGRDQVGGPLWRLLFLLRHLPLLGQFHDGDMWTERSNKAMPITRRKY